MGKIVKVLLISVLVLVVIAGAVTAWVYFQKTETRDIYSFVPPDFLYLVESDKPIPDWRSLSQTEVWQYLKGNDYFADMSGSADMLDSIINNNKPLAGMINLGGLVVTAHAIPGNSFDFLFLVDLKGGAKLNALSGVFTPIFEQAGYQVKEDKYFNYKLFDLYDATAGETLTLTIIDNILAGSFTKDLVHTSIQQTETGIVTDIVDFSQVKSRADRDKSYSIYLNYARLNDLLTIYMGEPYEMLDGLQEELSFSSTDLMLNNDKVVLNGFTKQNDSVASFFSIFKDVSKGKVRAPNILPEQTAMFMSLGFEKFEDFYDRFIAFYEVQNPEEYKDFNKRAGKIENYLNISLKEDFFSWIKDEIVLAVLPTDSLNSRYAYYALLHFDEDNYNEVKDKMDLIVRQIKRKFPVKFKPIDYKGFEIRYMKEKGILGLLFKKMFKQIEKPHYTFLDDYVVFSNDIASIQHIIDEYLKGKPLGRDKEYRKFARNFDSRSNVFLYIQNETFFNYLLSELDADTRRDLRNNKEYLLSFPQVGFQMSPASNMYRTYVYSEFEPVE